MTIFFICHFNLICFCSFDLSCPILEKDNFIKNLYIVLSCQKFRFCISEDRKQNSGQLKLAVLPKYQDLYFNTDTKYS